MQNNFHHYYRSDIDGLRALAVLLVLGYHLFPDTIKGGFVGVDIFFVISGYLISGIILNGLVTNTFSFKTFFARRIKRIFPVLIAVVAVTLLTGWFILLPKSFMELGKHTLGGVAFVANFTLWQDSGYFDSLPELKPLLHLWSLSIEEQFYLLWPAVLFFSFNYKIKMKNLCFVLIVLSFLGNLICIFKSADTAFYFPFFRFWEILLGALLVLIKLDYEFELSENAQDFLSVLGFVFILCANLLLNKNSLFPGFWALLPTIGAVFIISSEKSWLNKNIFSNKILVNIGLISYPLYLWHWPLISFMFVSYKTLPYGLDKIIIIAASFLLAWLSYHFLELPVRRQQNNFKVVMILCLLSIVMGIFGYRVFHKKGYPHRNILTEENRKLPKEIRALLFSDFGGNINDTWREHRCFLARDENFEKFAPECLETKRPLVFLWGDSHAAVFYDALRRMQGDRNFGVAQFTTSKCPPTINWSAPGNSLCQKINDYVLELVKRSKPEIVVLSAAWYTSEYDWKKIQSTIDILKIYHIKKIVVIGPVFGWDKKVPENIISYYKKFKQLPIGHTKFGLEIEDVRKVDYQLERLLRKNNVDYISLYQTFCNDKGCLLSLGNDITNVTSLDQGHLSSSAAFYALKTSGSVIFDQM